MAALLFDMYMCKHVNTLPLHPLVRCPDHSTTEKVESLTKLATYVLELICASIGGTNKSGIQCTC